MKHFPSFLQPGHTVRPFFVIRRINELDTRSFTQEKLLIINIHGLVSSPFFGSWFTDRPDRQKFERQRGLSLPEWSSAGSLDVIYTDRWTAADWGALAYRVCRISGGWWFWYNGELLSWRAGEMCRADEMSWSLPLALSMPIKYSIKIRHIPFAPKIAFWSVYQGDWHRRDFIIRFRVCKYCGYEWRQSVIHSYNYRAQEIGG